MTASVLTDELTAIIEAVRTNLATPGADTIATFSADSALVNGYETSVNIRQFSFRVDEPEKIGGTDTGPTPVELVLAGLGTCQEIVYATYARVLGIPLESVSVHAEGRLDLRGFFGVADVQAGFQDVTYDVDITSSAPAAEIERLIAAVNLHCPVLDILQKPISVVGSYRLNGDTLATN